jgi:O-antigen/teichoic acid export membrane protein
MTSFVDRGFFKNRDKFFTLADSGVVSIGRLLVSIALARLATTQGFADYILLLSVNVILLSLPATTIITPMVNLATGRRSGDRAAVFRWSHKRLRTVYSLFPILALVGLPIVLYADMSIWVYAGFAFATTAGLELQFQRACLQAVFRTQWALIADCIYLFVTILGIAVAFSTGSSPVGGFWWGSAIGGALGASAMWFARMRNSNPENSPRNDHPEKAIMERARQDGRDMLTGSIANSACSRLQPFVLSLVAGASAVASFGAAWTLVGPLRMLSAALNGMLRPRLAIHLANNDPKAFNRLQYAVYAALGAAGLAGVGIMIVIGPAIAAFLFGESLRAVGYVLPVALAYGTLDAITTSQMIVMQVKLGRGARTASRLRIQAAVVSLVLIVPACMYFGAWGAFLALIVAEGIYALQASRKLASTQSKPSIT